jgi:hypothetical protein
MNGLLPISGSPFQARGFIINAIGKERSQTLGVYDTMMPRGIQANNA